MKNKTFFYLLIIFITAFLFRFWYIDKPEGLWNDEYVGWFIASKSSFSEFINLISKNCHTPLYYVFLRLWLHLFPDTDLSLRMSSLLMSMLTVAVMYFTGKEYKDKNTGFLCALFTALSSFYIYFAQEVRLYSLLALISSLTVFSCIKLLKSGKKRFFALFIVLNALLCAIHTLGLIFSFFLFVFVVIYLYKNFDEWKTMVTNTKETLRYVFPFICVILLIFPFILSILFSKTLSQFWAEFSFFRPLFVFIDYFSPIQCNITNSHINISSYLIKDGNINYSFIVFAVIPSIMALFAIIKAVLTKNKILNILLYSALCFFISVFLLSALGKMILLSKYVSEIYPVLILAFASGILSFNGKMFKFIFSVIYFALSILYLYYSPFSAPKIIRAEGNNLPVILIENSRLKKGDNLLFTYYDLDKFERYFNNKQNYYIKSISKFNFNIPVFNNPNYYQTIKYGKDMYREKFKEYPNSNIKKWADNNIVKVMKKGEKIGLIYLEGVSFFSNENIQDIIADDKKYQKTSFIFLTFSMLRNSLMYALKDDFKIDSITQLGDWTLVVYEKIR